METYRTFFRSALSFEEFSTATKTPDEESLTLQEARERCQEWNANRTDAEIAAGTKLEFEAE